MDLDNRMISAEWLKNKFYEICDECNSSVIFIDRIIDEIDDAPDVEVVRCKDCKRGVWDEEEQLWECIVGADVTGDADTYAMFHEYNEAEHFCSYGERKDNGTD